MKHSLHTVLTLLFVCASAWGENVPWQNPQINEINREPAHAHFIPYTNEANALKQQALPAAQRFAVNPATERRISLDIGMKNGLILDGPLEPNFRDCSRKV